MFHVIEERIELEGQEPIIVEYGKYARQAHGSVLIRQGGTYLLVAACASENYDLTRDFFPLTVDYREQFYAAGKIPGGFFKRDGRPSDHEILISRLIDRSLRPLFPDDYTAEVQVIASLISTDRKHQPEPLAILGASFALLASDIPFPNPVAGIRIGKIGDEWVINPLASQMEASELDFIISGTKEAIVMVEGEAKEISEETLLEAFQRAHEVIRFQCEVQERFREKVGKTPRSYPGRPLDEALEAMVRSFAEPKIREIIHQPTTKAERQSRLKALREETLQWIASLGEERFLTPEAEVNAKLYYDAIKRELIRNMILEEGVRLDGRRTDEIRPIHCEVGLLPGAHGSALFTRGETQALVTVTIGTKLDEQMIDAVTIEGTKQFMLQYNFPPYSTGEVKPLRNPSRREIGHSYLAERALKNLVPLDDVHTIRVVSDILESNGSSSMATVCGASMALMDAGIKIPRHIAGIAMGLIVEDEQRYAILSDILGDEDHLGDMDFKVAGTENGITACQMDIKVKGLPLPILKEALEQARKGRLYIINEMKKAIAEPRPELPPHAPRFMEIEIPASMIGAVIGTGGKTIRELQRETDTKIYIEQDNSEVGKVVISSSDKASLEKAAERIHAIVKQPEVGEVYNGKVVKILDSGAVVEFLPGKTGWLPISEITHEHIDDIRDHLKVGKTYKVKLIHMDLNTGKIRLSIKALHSGPVHTKKIEDPKPDRSGPPTYTPRKFK